MPKIEDLRDEESNLKTVLQWIEYGQCRTTPLVMLAEDDGMIFKFN